MKMKQKGIATAVIAVVVIVVIAVVGVGAFLVLRGRGVEGVAGLPKYTGANKTDTVAGGTPGTLVSGVLGKGQSVPTGVEYEVYTTPTGTSVSDVMSYYRTEMASAGWSKIYDNTFDYSWGTISCSYGLLYFEKGDRAAAAGVVSYTYEGESYLYFGIIEGPKTTFEGWMTGAGYEWEEEVTPGGGVSGATSLDFKVDYTYAGQTYTYRERARNIGTANMDLRIDITMAGTTTAYILSGSQQQGWLGSGGTWMSFSDLGMNFSEQYSAYSGGFSTYTGYLSDWMSGEWSGTYGGITYRIYDILVNPSLPDSVFQPS